MLHEEGIKLVASSLVRSNSLQKLGLEYDEPAYYRDILVRSCIQHTAASPADPTGCHICSGVRRRCRRVLNAGAQNMSVCVTVNLGDVCVTERALFHPFSEVYLQALRENYFCY